MIFRQIEEILTGQKTQTRRVYKPGEYAVDSEGYTAVAYTGHRDMAETIHSVYTPCDRLKWQVGRDYAVVPGRGKPALWVRDDGVLVRTPLDEYLSRTQPEDAPRATWGPKVRRWLVEHGYTPLRIRITAIRQERLQDISEADACAEGCRGGTAYALMAGEQFVKEPAIDITPCDEYRDLWESINGKGSWSANPSVWVLQFEVVH